MENKSKSDKETLPDVMRRQEDVEECKSVDITEATFETAITATGFGKFNYLLISLCVPCGWAAMMTSTTMSYIIPAAHCDLDMDLQQRGMLNAITYLGMISSALIWGFLADTLGRRKILVAGYLADAICVLIASLSQSYGMLVTAKYFTGLIMNGPFAALTTVISEFHCAKYRTRILMGLGITYSMGQLIIPGLAWLVIPRNMEYDLLNGNMKLHSWNFFIMICAIPSLIASIGHSFLPESPKFLMTMGKNEEALRVFKKVYSNNTGLHPDTFPVKSLVDEIKLNADSKHGGLVTANRSKTQALKEGFKQMIPMFQPPLVWRILLVSIIQFGFLWGTNTIRLWLPQILTAINDYQMLYPGVTASLCTMLEIIVPNNNITLTEECTVNDVADFVYMNAMIVAATSAVLYSFVGTVINKVGKKPSLVTLSTLSGAATIGLYFAQNSTTTVALSALNVCCLGICLTLELTVVVDIFPTTLRAIAVSITLMIGRTGAMLGNVLFPYLLALGCMPPFILTGCLILACMLLTTILPKSDLKALE